MKICVCFIVFFLSLEYIMHTTTGWATRIKMIDHPSIWPVLIDQINHTETVEREREKENRKNNNKTWHLHDYENLDRHVLPSSKVAIRRCVRSTRRTYDAIYATSADSSICRARQTTYDLIRREVDEAIQFWCVCAFFWLNFVRMNIEREGTEKRFRVMNSRWLLLRLNNADNCRDSWE